MPPNTIDPPFEAEGSRRDDIESKLPSAPPAPAPSYEINYNLKIFQSTLNQLAHILIGAIVGIVYLFAFRNGLPLGSTPLHIVLCVTGYQLLMAQAILSLSKQNSWSSHLKLIDKRRVHWILQICGSALAIAGSIIKMMNKTAHWETLHGKFGLVALVFTTVSLVNGLASLYAFEFRRILSANLSKLTHICFGTVAFVTAAITLCYGFDKGGFRNWSGDGMAYACIAFTSTFTFIVIVNPLFTFTDKLVNTFRK